ncbi:uncharacterized protein LOC124128516 [Haliotis rufescens]|uniref:uncharacterized protein LOC124128516 n=1 Tax=Haliotis rufescens TaxID=6454 RepID=UPI00201F21A6|nr:uncharacterized protein LOC124128516 [Haliotis rufescens]
MTDHTTRSPAVHLHYHDNFPGDILLQDVYVPDDGAQPHTYYACLEWNNSADGQGYLGIQDHGNGDRSYIYSIWDPHDTSLPVSTAVFTGLWTKVSFFGNEGKGIHMGNHSLGWAPNYWYTMVNRLWQDGGHTRFGFWVHNQTSKVWTHLVTFDYPVKDVTFHTTTDSFMEDFQGSGRPDRKVRFGHGYKRGTDKTWHPLDTAHLHVNQGFRVKDWEHNYNAGVDYGYYFVETGENIHPTTGLGTEADFKITLPPAPIKPAIEFEITEAKSHGVQWKVPETSTPQFRYTVDLNGQELINEIEPEVRSFPLNVDHPGQEVKVTIEDLLGNVVSKTAQIKD